VANRTLLTDRSDVAVARASRTGTTPAMVLLDLDGFKDVNDTMGHSAGDELLRAVAARLLLQVRPGDTVARFGGDEFAVLVEDCASPDDALDLAHRLLAATSEPVEIDERELRVTASVGVVVHTDQDGGELLRCADLAMYAAKRRGKNTVVLFEPAMRAMTEERVQLTAELRTAVADGQMAVAYQPVVDLQTEEVVGFEALARWIHPERGTIPPLTFIPLAEDSGAILELGRHVLALACAQVHEWSRRAGRRFVISVNVSGRQLADPGFTTDVRHVLALSGLPAEQLVLEITETTVIEDVAAARTRLAGLRRLGLRIAIDDFGTGYSSLSYLRNLPVDILKIDKSFVDDDTSQHGGELLAGVVALGSALALETLGEGIETSRQLQRLRAAGCQQGQGYHFARPLFPADVEQLLGDLHPSVPARP
jgi:diguanylate cyclase (GGDEF)-like protein